VFLNTENISAFVGFSWKIEIEMHGATMKITDGICLQSTLRLVANKMPCLFPCEGNKQTETAINLTFSFSWELSFAPQLDF
jgi:hypothetical protein